MRLLRGVAGWATFAVLCAGMVCALSSSVDAEQVTLRLHTFSAPQAIANRVFIQPWAQAIEEKSGNRVEIQVFTAMQLGGKPSDLYGQARDGVVDIVWTLPGYSPGRFPLTEVFELPSVAGNAVATSQALTEFYRKWMRNEYKDTRLNGAVLRRLRNAGQPASEAKPKPPITNIAIPTGIRRAISPRQMPNKRPPNSTLVIV